MTRTQGESDAKGENTSKARYTPVRCKFCGDWEFVVKYGRTDKGTQRYLCRNCKRTFLDNRAPERMRYSSNVIASALNQFYEGAPLHKIRRQVKLDFGVIPDHSTIYDWIVRYTRKALKAFESATPHTSNTWVAVETVLKLKSKDSKYICLFDCLDEHSRFLLASHLTPEPDIGDALTLIEKAEKRAGKTPEVVVSDRFVSYSDAVEQAFNSGAKHVHNRPYVFEQSTNRVERMHRTLKDRGEIIRRFSNRETAKLIMEGWYIHYNFFRPHPGLADKTPAQVAVVEAPYTRWAEVVKAK